MTKKLLTVLIFLMSFSTLFAQHRVIVVMAEKYDEAHLSAKMHNMTKAQRRDFVIQERMAFCHASQQAMVDLMNI